MKFIAPEGVGAVSWAGVGHAVVAGSLDLPEAAAAELTAHGFTPAAQTVPPAPDSAPAQKGPPARPAPGRKG